jgi:hypothetical protein
MRMPQKEHRDMLHQTFFLHPVGSMGHVVRASASSAQNVDTLIFHALVATLRIPQKARQDTLHKTCVIASDGIYGSCSAFW